MPAFLRTVVLAFAQRRKTLRNALGAAWGKDAATRTLERAAIPPNARAEELGLDRFLALHRARRALGGGL
jgi:16S rRNA A1518/A1519 N6-dimethyltransferase RsmA/KsgA/DIM1 with predicted DNA glycosylase/AP lyase activity